MNNSKFISVFKDTAHYLTTFSPLAFSMAVCFGFSEAIAAALACLAVIFAPEPESGKIMPVYLSFMILGYSFTALNAGVGALACIVCGILLIISAFFYDKLKNMFAQPAVSGIMLACALTATILFTTDYFGIGATGATARDMIKSYISLGFHPNWRGILYGTIVMVIMITFPRKFKKFTKSVSAPFIAIAATLILNLFLNPSDMATAINEITDSSKNNSLLLTEAALPDATLENVLNIILCGVALFVVCFHSIANNENASKKDFIIGGISNGIAGSLCSMPLPYGINKNKSTVLPRIIAAVIMLIMFYFGKEFMLRIPVHSCAVVIIVGAWQSVKWGDLKKTFSGIASVICFAVTAIGFILFDIASGVVFAFFVSMIYSLVFNKNHKFLK